jgi:hypothetical protein
VGFADMVVKKFGFIVREIIQDAKENKQSRSLVSVKTQLNPYPSCDADADPDCP